MKKWIRPLVSFGLLALLFWFIPWHELRTALGRLPAVLWVGVVCGFLAGHSLGVSKWRLLINAGRSNLGRLDAIRCYAAGLFTNMCLPSLVGGDVLRVALATKAIGRPEAALLGGLADRLSDTIALIILLTAGGVLAHGSLPGWGKQVMVFGFIVLFAVCALILPLLLRRPLARWPARFRRPGARALVALRRLGRQPRLAATALMLSLFIQASFVLLNAWMAQRIGVDIPLAAWFLVWPLSKLAALVPISLGGLGVREATLAGLLIPFGVPPAVGVLAALLWQTILITGGLLSGAVWWALSRRAEMPSLRRQPALT
jgi:uncharacterized membrane protein YbhN (UPF0104 family)